MTMKILIYDYMDRPKEITIEKEVYAAFLLVISGDQILYVRYKDGTDETFDSCETFRNQDFLDYSGFIDLEDGMDLKNAK